MSMTDEQLLHAIHTIETQLTAIKQSLSGVPGKEEGVVGTFDGEYIQLQDGRRFPIPPNYASKSMLVAGDTLRMTEDTSGGEQHRFKQIAKIERAKATGILTRKDGKFEVVCEDGSFKVLAAAIKHFEAQPGDLLTIQFAKNHLKGSWAAVEKLASQSNSPHATTAATTDPVLVATAQPTTVTHTTQITPATTIQRPTESIGHQAAPSELAEPSIPAIQAQASQPVVEPEVAAQSPAPAFQSAVEPTNPSQPAAQPTDQAVNEVKPSAPAATSQPANKPMSSTASNRPQPKITGASSSQSRSSSKPARPVNRTSPSSYATKPNPSPSPSAQPVQPKPAPAAVTPPRPNLPVNQGEISIPVVMDDDDLT